jgi:hypothetical protein
MNAEFHALALALRNRLAVIADHAHRESDSAGHLQRLMDASATIDSLVAALPTNALPTNALDPQFRHYLDRKSYDKALAWIESAS